MISSLPFPAESKRLEVKNIIQFPGNMPFVGGLGFYPRHDVVIEENGCFIEDSFQNSHAAAYPSSIPKIQLPAATLVLSRRKFPRLGPS